MKHAPKIPYRGRLARAITFSLMIWTGVSFAVGPLGCRARTRSERPTSNLPRQSGDSDARSDPSARARSALDQGSVADERSPRSPDSVEVLPHNATVTNAELNLAGKTSHPATAVASKRDSQIAPATEAAPTKQVVRLSDYTDMIEAVATAGEQQSRLIIDVPCTLAGDFILPGNLELAATNEGHIHQNGKQLTVYGQIAHTSAPLFAGSGTVVFKTGSVPCLRARWWKGDDTTIIRRALRSAAGSEVRRVLVDGEFTITETIALDSADYSGITIFGNGPETVLYTGADTTTGVLMFYVNGRETKIQNLVFERFVLDGNNAFGSQGIYTQHGPAPFGVHGIKVREITARNFGKTGFYFGGHVEGNKLKSHNNGMHGFVARDGEVVLEDIRASNNFIGIDVAGGRWGYSTRARIKTFTFNENRAMGAKVAIAEDGNQISASFSDGEFRDNESAGFTATFPNGVTDFSGIDVSMKRVSAVGNGHTGLIFKAGISHLENITADGNAGYGVLAGGIRTEAKHISAKHNKLTGIAAVACKLEDVVVSSNGEAGIRINRDCTLTGGTVSGNAGYGIKVFGATATIQSIEFGKRNSASPQLVDVGVWNNSTVVLKGMPDATVRRDRSSRVIQSADPEL